MLAEYRYLYCSQNCILFLYMKLGGFMYQQGYKGTDLKCGIFTSLSVKELYLHRPREEIITGVIFN